MKKITLTDCPTAFENAAAAVETARQKQREELDLQEKRNMESNTRYKVALERKKLEEEYSRILKLLEQAERMQRQQKADLVAYRPKGKIVMCPPVDKMIRENFQSSLEQCTEKIFRSSKEHAIEDLEGYSDEIEKRFQYENTVNCPPLDDISYSSLMRKDSFDEKYFLAKETEKRLEEKPNDVLNTAYLETPPTLEMSPASEGSGPASDKPDGTSSEKRNAAVQAETSSTLESKGVQAEVKCSSGSFENKEDAKSMFHTPRKCFDVVKEHLLGRDSKSSSSVSTAYCSLPTSHGLPMFPSLYSSDNKENSDDIHVTSSVSGRKVFSCLPHFENVETYQQNRLFTAGSLDQTRYFPPLRNVAVSSAESLTSYVKCISPRCTLEEKAKILSASSGMPVCAVPLGDPIRVKPQECADHGGLSTLREKDSYSSKQLVPFQSVPGLHENVCVPQISSDRSDALQKQFSVSSMKRSFAVPCEETPLLQSSVKDETMSNISLLANVSQPDEPAKARDVDNDLQERSNSSEDFSPRTLALEPKTCDLEKLKTIREALYAHLKQSHPSLQKDPHCPSEDDGSRSQQTDVPSSKDIPFVYHELSTIEEMDSSLTAMQLERRHCSASTWQGEDIDKESDEACNGITKESQYPLTSLLDVSSEDMSHLLEKVKILPLSSPQKSSENTSEFQSLPDAAKSEPSSGTQPFVSPNQSESEEVCNSALETAYSVSTCESSAKSTFHPITPQPYTSGLSNACQGSAASSVTSFNPLTPQSLSEFETPGGKLQHKPHMQNSSVCNTSYCAKSNNKGEENIQKFIKLPIATANDLLSPHQHRENISSDSNVSYGRNATSDASSHKTASNGAERLHIDFACGCKSPDLQNKDETKATVQLLPDNTSGTFKRLCPNEKYLSVGALHTSMKQRSEREDGSSSTAYCRLSLKFMSGAESNSSEDSLVHMFKGLKTAYQSTPVRPISELSGEEGILDQPDLALVGGESTLHVPSELEKDVANQAAGSSHGKHISEAENSSALKTCAHTKKMKEISVTEQENKPEKKIANSVGCQLSNSLASFLQHEISSESHEEEHVSLICAQKVPAPVVSGEMTPRHTETYSDGCSSKGKGKWRKDSPSCSSEYKERTKRLWNNLEEVKAKHKYEEKKKTIALNKKKVKELQMKLQNKRKLDNKKSK